MQENRPSRYVFPSGDMLYNSMNRVWIAADSSEDDLRKGFFLAGQEKESLDARLFAKPDHLAVKIIPTWECNLRCKHCSVLHRLKRRDDFEINPDDVIRFMRSLGDHYGIKKFSLFFIGGECLLKTKECLLIADAVVPAMGEENIALSLTTNLSLDLTPDSVKFLSMTKSFDVSLDGTESQHNWQRKPHKDYEEINPYRKTFFNIMRLVKLGFSEKMKIKAAVQDCVSDEAEKIKLFEDLVKIGVPFENIIYGGVHPTKNNPKVDETYTNYLKEKTFWKVPCCDYRYMSHFSFNPDGSLDDDYFLHIQDRSSFNISEFGRKYGIKELEFAYEQKIRNNLSIMQDEVCLGQCPVVAYCWGRCHNNGFVTKNPSSHCDMKGLEEGVKKSMSCGLNNKSKEVNHDRS